MKQKKYLLVYLLAVLMFTFFNKSEAQVVTGGAVSFDYDDGYFFDANPTFGYRYSIIESGIAPFVSYRENPEKLAYGLRVYALAEMTDNIFVQAEFQAANVEKGKSRIWQMGMPVGAGYQHNVTGNTWVRATFLYDVFHDDNSPQRNPIIRLGMFYRL